MTARDLTADEQKILGLLAEVWNRFVQLPIVHPMDQQEFCQSVHVLQNAVMARAVHRLGDGVSYYGTLELEGK